MDINDNRFDNFIVANFPNLLPRKADGSGAMLYHYTMTDVLEILSKPEADLLLTKCSFLNDDAEFELGIKVVMDFLRRNPSYNNCGVVQGIVDEFRQYAESVPWIFSLSREADSLYQWIAYTDKHKGGINIGIDFARLQRLVQDNNKVSRTYGESLMFLAPCFYVEELFSKELDILMHYVFGEYKSHLAIKGDQRYITIFLIFIVASLVKSKPFEYENEWRIVVIPSSQDLELRYTELGGRPRIFSGIFGKEQVFKDIWVEVKVSPQGSNFGLADLIMKARGVTCPLVKSKITYNGR